jgi:hypothetical protein
MDSTLNRLRTFLKTKFTLGLQWSSSRSLSFSCLLPSLVSGWFYPSQSSPTRRWKFWWHLWVCSNFISGLRQMHPKTHSKPNKQLRMLPLDGTLQGKQLRRIVRYPHGSSVDSRVHLPSLNRSAISSMGPTIGSVQISYFSLYPALGSLRDLATN